MAYEDRLRYLLEKAGAAEGDTVRVTTHEGRAVEGVVMPHHAFSDPHVLTLKLDNGYNVGVALREGAAVERVAEAPPRPDVDRELPSGEGLPAVSLLGTGGTIASYVDYRTGAVHPATSPEELAFSDPTLFEVANLRARVVFQEFSEDLTPAHWAELAREVAEEFNGGARGVVIPHGTDTLGYTAAALSFMLTNLPGPVVLVGAQRSSDRPSTDAELNLRAAVRVAATADLGEVVAVMHGDVGDTRCLIHRGTRVRKMHTSRRDAFQSVNAHPIGWADADLVELAADARPAGEGPVQVDDRLETRVRLLHYHPGMTSDDIPSPDAVAGLVIAGTGLGHVGHPAFPALQALAEAGRPVVMASQCIHGRVNMNVYSTGRELQRLGVTPAGDTLPETALVKLMHLLGRGSGAEEVAALMAQSLRGEVTERTLPTVYEGPAGAHEEVAE